MIHYRIGSDSTRCCVRVSEGRIAGVRGLSPGLHYSETSHYGDSELAATLSKLTGEARTQAVPRALRDRLERIRRRRAGRSLAAELDEIALHCASLPVLDDRVAEDMLGYDERGMPDRWSSTRRR